MFSGAAAPAPTAQPASPTRPPTSPARQAPSAPIEDAGQEADYVNLPAQGEEFALRALEELEEHDYVNILDPTYSQSAAAQTAASFLVSFPEDDEEEEDAATNGFGDASAVDEEDHDYVNFTDVHFASPGGSGSNPFRYVLVLAPPLLCIRSRVSICRFQCPQPF
eukprot:m.239782 g.239782  ORF g.239782 m.239782 type:complete len:165 (-) comp10921_c0_seq11:4130-4624(-)